MKHSTSRSLAAILAFFCCASLWAAQIPTGVKQDKAKATTDPGEYANLPIGFHWVILDKHHAEIYFDEPGAYQDLNYLVTTATNFASYNILLTSYSAGVVRAINNWAIKNEPTLFTVKCGASSCTGKVKYKNVCVQKTCTLPEKFANLTLTGSAALNGTGNVHGNVIRGNSTANVLNGLAGDDKLRGDTGKDTLTDLEGNNSLSGGGGNDTLTAGEGNDVLNGGTGNDKLSGGGGNDRFRFGTALDAKTNVDTIADFAPGSDQILLKTSVFSIPHKYMGKNLGTITEVSRLESGPGLTRATAPATRLLYDTNSGTLYYDADGSESTAAPVKFAVLTGSPVLVITDFALY